MSSYNEIVFQVDAGIATLMLNRPGSHNSLNLKMGREFQQALAVVERESDIRCLILSGVGADFCSGRDTSDSAPPDDAAYASVWGEVLFAIRSSRVPVVAAINGSAVGDGCLLAVSSDLLLASPSAEFLQLFGCSGFAAELGLDELMASATVGFKAQDVSNTNKRVSALQALQWGLINECVEEAQLLPRARVLAAKLAAGPTQALAMTRRLVDEGTANTFEAQYRRELEVNSELRECFDGKEGVQAFLEKRAARFQGK